MGYDREKRVCRGWHRTITKLRASGTPRGLLACLKARVPMNIPRTALFILFWTLAWLYGVPVAAAATTVIGAALWLAWKIVADLFGI